MKTFKYEILSDDEIIAQGYLTASTKEVFEFRFEREILPQIKEDFSRTRYRELYCQECDSGNDVIQYYQNEESIVLCRDCRFRSAIERKKKNG